MLTLELIIPTIVHKCPSECLFNFSPYHVYIIQPEINRYQISDQSKKVVLTNMYCFSYVYGKSTDE